MYITITAQKLGKTYGQSSGGFVAYLEKENQGLEQEEMEHFLTSMAMKFQPRKWLRKLMETQPNSKTKNLNFIPLRSALLNMN